MFVPSPLKYRKNADQVRSWYGEDLEQNSFSLLFIVHSVARHKAVYSTSAREGGIGPLRAI